MPLAPNEYKIDTTEPLPEWKRRLGMFTRIVEQEPEPDDEGDPDVEGDDEGQPDEDENGEEDGEGPGDEEDPAEGGRQSSENPESGTADKPEEPGKAKGPFPLDDLTDDGPTLDEILARKPQLILERDSAGNITRTFASWSDFVACAADPDLYAWKRTHQSHAHGRADWAGTASFEEAVRLATITGWPEGLRLMQDTMILVRPKPEPFRSIEMSVAGAFPMVPNYCAGDPECMVIDPGSDMRTAKPVIRIDYNIGGTASISMKALMLRGAAVLSLADALERKGISTELRVTHTDQAYGSPVNRYAIVFKKAGEPLDLDRAAFAIANPSTLRRFGFALIEQIAEFERNWASDYGRSIEVPFDLNPDIISIPGAIYNETPATARLSVQKACEAVLPDIFE